MKIRDTCLFAGLQKKTDDIQKIKCDWPEGNYMPLSAKLVEERVVGSWRSRPVHDWDMLNKLILQ